MKAAELKALRLKLKHSQQTLADALGLSARQIIRYEMNKAEIPQTVVMALRSVNTRKRGEKQ